MGRSAKMGGTLVGREQMMERSMTQLENVSTPSAALDQNSTLICVVEMSLKSWLVAGLVPGIERQPLKKLEADEAALYRLVLRWKAEAERAGRRIARIALAFEAGRDGFWLARWLRARGIEAWVIHPTSIAVSRDHRRPKTDRLDTQMLMRAFLGWLRGEPGHCRMAAIPTREQEDAKRPTRERETLVAERTRIINRTKSALIRLGIRSFNPGLRKARERLASLRTPEGVPIPPNTLAEIHRDLARLAVVQAQIAECAGALVQCAHAAEVADRGPGHVLGAALVAAHPPAQLGQAGGFPLPGLA